MARKKAASSADMFGEQSVDAELFVANTATSDSRLHEGRSRRRRVATVAFFVLGSVAIVNGLNLTINPPEQKLVTSEVTSADVNASVGKSAAYAKVQAWLGAEKSPLPGGYIIAWDGYTFEKGGKAKSQSDRPANDAETHSFTLGVQREREVVFYTASVQVSVEKGMGAKVMGEPSLLPRTPAVTDGWSGELWPNMTTSTATEAIRESAAAWATAFTSSPANLRLYVGDTDAANSYVPLQGASVVQTNVGAVAYKAKDGVKEDAPATVIARIDMSITWGANDQAAPVSYDVLIEQANTASPKIVAWGAVGSGPKLERFGNAVKVKVVATKPDTAPQTLPPATPETPQAPAPETPTTPAPDSPAPVDPGTGGGPGEGVNH